ncbi:spore germination protein GerPE [Cohnella endophytica]|uniref:Spore germination protein GerPE n=1 Tax=Cohnella endophytica TaxID=2419778 RepID=A0A494YB90_9BACL|nr:spore germination protein GerPE [Cohnella endophytica]RKP57202.1 spore germination protein GerPE [Cohnella endophytica]
MTLQCRNANVGWLFVNTVSSAGIVQLGDGEGTTQKSKALAVQSAIPTHEADEFKFAAYPLYYLPKLSLKPCVPVTFRSRSPWPTIQIGSIRTLGVSSSSLLRIGCSGPVEGENRIKDFRQFNNLNIR